MTVTLGQLDGMVVGPDVTTNLKLQQDLIFGGADRSQSRRRLGCVLPVRNGIENSKMDPTFDQNPKSTVGEDIRVRGDYKLKVFSGLELQ